MRTPWRRRTARPTRAEMEDELQFWRNYAALAPYSIKRERIRIPAQRTGTPPDPRWTALLRNAERRPRDRRR